MKITWSPVAGLVGAADYELGGYRVAAQGMIGDIVDNISLVSSQCIIACNFKEDMRSI